MVKYILFIMTDYSSLSLHSISNNLPEIARKTFFCSLSSVTVSWEMISYFFGDWNRNSVSEADHNFWTWRHESDILSSKPHRHLGQLFLSSPSLVSPHALSPSWSYHPTRAWPHPNEPKLSRSGCLSLGHKWCQYFLLNKNCGLPCKFLIPWN